MNNKCISYKNRRIISKSMNYFSKNKKQKNKITKKSKNFKQNFAIKYYTYLCINLIKYILSNILINNELVCDIKLTKSIINMHSPFHV